MSDACEIWRAIPGYDGYYEISNYGRVHRIKLSSGAIVDRFLRATLDQDGYPQLTLCLFGKEKCRKIHTLVAAAFLGPRPNGCDVNHIDGNKLNSHVSNVKCVNYSPRNNIHLLKLGRCSELGVTSSAKSVAALLGNT